MYHLITLCSVLFLGSSILFFPSAIWFLSDCLIKMVYICTPLVPCQIIFLIRYTPIDVTDIRPSSMLTPGLILAPDRKRSLFQYSGVGWNSSCHGRPRNISCLKSRIIQFEVYRWSPICNAIPETNLEDLLSVPSLDCYIYTAAPRMVRLDLCSLEKNLEMIFLFHPSSFNTVAGTSINEYFNMDNGVTGIL